MTAPGQDAGDNEAEGLDLRPHQGGGNGDGHADHAEEVAAPGGGGVGQSLEGQDEENGRAEIGDGLGIGREFHGRLLTSSS
jgi:hypothetical protein